MKTKKIVTSVKDACDQSHKRREDSRQFRLRPRLHIRENQFSKEKDQLFILKGHLVHFSKNIAQKA